LIACVGVLLARVSPEFATTLFPLVAALLYAFGALVLKRSSDLGVGLWRTTFVANVIVAALFSLLWLLGGPPVQKELLWQPGVIALCLFVGQLSQFLALEKGDVSVAVPIFGLKVILVAFFTPFLIGEAVGMKLWIAAFLSVLGITFLNRKDADQPPRHLLVTFIAGAIGAVAFAVFDVLVQKWGPSWGAGRLLPCIFWINALRPHLPFLRAFEQGASQSLAVAGGRLRPARCAKHHLRQHPGRLWQGHERQHRLCLARTAQRRARLARRSLVSQR
jgi:drug/metabolite transporter (DMT)-like permease